MGLTSYNQITVNYVIISFPQKQRFCGNFLKICMQLTCMPVLGYNLVNKLGFAHELKLRFMNWRFAP